jgi:O-antigen/teichoic acid export membrane protein
LIQKYLGTIGVLFAAVGITVLGPLLISVFGPDFQEGLKTFRVLMLVAALVSSNLILRKLLPAGHAENEYAVVMTARTTLLLVLCLLLTRRGSEGAAWAVLIAEASTVMLSIYLFRTRFAPNPVLRYTLQVFAAGAVLALTIWLLQSHMVAGLLAGAGLYAAVLLAVRAITHEPGLV